jgi:hypothetical protein
MHVTAGCFAHYTINNLKRKAQHDKQKERYICLFVIHNLGMNIGTRFL